MGTEILDEVFEVIKDRRENPKEKSYVSGLLASGGDAILEKIGEEARELAEAAEGGKSSEIVHEAADTIFHIMVLLAAKGVEFEEVMKELEERRRPR